MNKSLRKRIKERANYLCEYCLSPERFCPSYFEGDHIRPQSEGGNDSFENFANACGGCNNNKSNATHSIDPLTGKSVALYNPRVHTWGNHFCWDESSTLIIGLSPIGRATIQKLKLNRNEVINLRTLLLSVGLHPPS
jgi:hypothetical protein